MTAEQIISEATRMATEVNAEDQNSAYKTDSQAESFAARVYDKAFNPLSKGARQLFILTFVEVYQSL